MKKFRNNCSVIRPVNNKMSWLSIFSHAKICLLVLLLTGSFVQTKKATSSKLQLEMSKYSNSKLGDNSKNVDTLDEHTFKEAFCACSSLQNYFKRKLVEKNSFLPLTKKELGELIRNIADVLSGKYLNSENFHSDKNYELIKNKLELYGYLSKPTVYAPEHELYNKMWNSFGWRVPLKRFARPQDAQQIIKQLDDSLYLSSKLTWSEYGILSKFFQKQPLYFDNKNPRREKFSTSPTATYNFVRNFKIPERLKHLMPRSMSVVEAIEDAQNMLSFQPSGWRYRLRHLNITTLNLEKCSSSGGTVPPPSVHPTFVPPSIECGKPVTNSKIFGGTVSKKGTWPWMAHFFFLMSNDPEDHFCGGSLISDKHILTAAHCLFGVSRENVQVFLGEHDLKSFNYSASSTDLKYEIDNLFVHESFSFQASNRENDIALIKLKKKVMFNDNIRPICLPTPDISIEGKNGYIVGWGKTENSDRSPNLLDVRTLIWEKAKCQNTGLISNGDKQLCVGLLEGGVGQCSGDSGGPLMFQTSSGHWITVGIGSFVLGNLDGTHIYCGEQGYPAVNTRITAYLDWINAKLLL